MLVIPATQEAEVEESLEPRARDCSEPRSCLCTPAWATRVKFHLKTKQNKTKTECFEFFMSALRKVGFGDAMALEEKYKYYLILSKIKLV